MSTNGKAALIGLQESCSYLGLVGTVEVGMFGHPLSHDKVESTGARGSWDVGEELQDGFHLGVEQLTNEK